MDRKKLTHKALLYRTEFNPYISFEDIEIIFSGRAEGRAIKFVFHGGLFSQKQLQKGIDCDHKVAKRIIDNFHRVGMIKRIQEKYVTYYQINKESNIVRSLMWMLNHTRYKS